ncbi:MAG: Helix-turn-helix domain protein [bacterium ADurb.Bin363]|nr:MAG: Helix-turn-helix domain protein [bacterium ADurb.Bin363]
MNKTSGRLKRLRLHMGLTQKELGDKLGVPWYLIKNIETEKTKLSIELAEGLYKNLGVNINWILSGEGERFLETNFHPLPEEEEKLELIPEVKKIVYDMKEVTNKIIDLNKKIMVQEDKGIYKVSSEGGNKRRYPLISASPFTENCRDEYIELPEEWNISADFVINTEGMTDREILPPVLCFIRKQKELTGNDMVALKIYENHLYQLILSKVEYVNGLMEFQDSRREKIENFEIIGIAIFWMSDYRINLK